MTVRPKLNIMNSGIYKITNIINNKFYIGSSKDLNKRLSRHKIDLRSNRHTNQHLQRSWNKYGEINFTFIIIDYCDISKLIEFEQFYIDLYEPNFNMCKIANSCLGIKRSNKTKRKMSAARKGMKFTKEHCKNLSISKIGKSRILTEEHKQKISMGNKGKIISLKTRRKLSRLLKNKPWSNTRRAAQNNRK